jgi:hypothetical protein
MSFNVDLPAADRHAGFFSPFQMCRVSFELSPPVRMRRMPLLQLLAVAPLGGAEPCNKYGPLALSN